MYVHSKNRKVKIKKKREKKSSHVTIHDIPGKSKDQVQNLDRSQELGIFHVKPKVE